MAQRFLHRLWKTLENWGGGGGGGLEGTDDLHMSSPDEVGIHLIDERQPGQKVFLLHVLN